MNITNQDREKILSVFRENLQGISISDISRRSGINRNKTARIAEDFYLEGVVRCNRQSVAKIYTLITDSAIYPVMSLMSDPAILVDDQFRILQVNPAFIQNLKGSGDIYSGVSLNEIKGTIPGSILSDIRDFIQSGRNGESRVFHEENLPVCTGILISLIEERSGLIIIFPGFAKRSEDQGDLHLGVLKTLTCRLPDIASSSSTNEAFSLTAGIIHDLLPDVVILTVLIDENDQTSRLNSFHIPQNRFTDANIPEYIHAAMATPVQIPGIKLLKFKSGKPVQKENLDFLFTGQLGIEEKLSTSILPDRMSMIGISDGNLLIGLFAISSNVRTSVSGIIPVILESVARFLTIASMFQRKTADIQMNLETYQNNYRDLYSRLIDTTEENNMLVTDGRLLISVLADILDNYGILFLSLDQDAQILSANRMAKSVWGITDMDRIRGVSILNNLPKTLADDVLRGLTGDPAGPVSGRTVENDNSSLFWYLVRGKHPQTTYFLIVEPKSGSLVPYLVENK